MSEIPMGAPGIPTAPGGPGGQPGPADEILVAFAEPAEQRRLTVLVRLILAIPHLVVLWVLSIAAEVVALICWFAALVTGRLPDTLAEFQVGYLRWATRFYAYLFLLTDEYPPFEFSDANYPIRLRAEPGRLNRLAVLFRIILVIPAWIVSVVLGYGLSFLVMFVTWLIVLIAGRMPRPLHEAVAAAVRYQARVSGYFLMLTAQYPGGLFGDPGTSAFGMGPAGGEFAAGSAGPAAPAAPGFAGGPGFPEGQESTEAPAGPGTSAGRRPAGRGTRPCGTGRTEAPAVPGWGQPGPEAPGAGQPGWGPWGQPESGQPGYSGPAGGGAAGYGSPAGYGQPRRGSPATRRRGTASPRRGTASLPRRSAGSAGTSPGGSSCPARPSAWSPCSSCWG